MSGSLCITHMGIKPCTVGSLRIRSFFFDRQFCEWWHEVGGREAIFAFLPQIRCLGFSLPCGSDENIQIAGPR